MQTALSSRLRAIALSTLLSCSLLAAPGANATPAPAGAVIGNQASATYSDASAVSRTVTSNTALTTVQQVGSLTLAAPSAKTISPGGQVYYPQTLVNTGNGSDSFLLTAAQSGSTTMTTVLFYTDANGDGIPDSATPITSTGTLTPGQTFKFVVAGVTPSTAVVGTTNTTTVTATSVFAPTVSAAVAEGASAVSAVKVRDETPAWTVFSAATCGTLRTGITACSVTAQPSVGASGSVEWTLTGSLPSGATGTVVFSVTVQ